MLHQHSPTLRIAAAALLATLLPAADTPPERDWNLSLGLGAGIGPEYPGSDTTTVTPVPLIDARWRLIVLDTARLGAPFLGARLATRDRELVVHLGAAYLGGRDSGDDDRLAAESDIDPTLVAALTAEWTPGHGPFLLRGVATQDLLDEGHGATILVQALLRAPPMPHLRIQGGIGAVWADGTHMDTWFGAVAGSAANPGPAFAADPGIREIHAVVEARIPITDRWSLVGRVTGGNLQGDAADSPLTIRETQVRGIAGIVYAF